jgi:outer membrane autotransporter protein
VTVAAGGTLMPGQPLGTLNVAGSVTFNPSSIYAVSIAPGANARTTITGAPGTLVINGGSVLVTAQLGRYNATTDTIASATGGRSGTFASLAFAGPFTYSGSATLSYDANDVFLDLGAGSVIFATPAGANLNQRNVLDGINGAILAGAAPPPQFQNLGGLPGATFLGALTQLSGEAGAGFSQGAFQAGNQFLGLMVNPFLDGRFGDGGGFGAASGFAAEEPPALPQAAAAFASALPVKAAAPASFDNRYGVWGSAFGGTGSVSGDPILGSHTTTASAYGFAAGVDYRMTPDTTVGFALAGGGTNWGLDAGLGGGRSDMFQAGLYGSQRWGAAYLSGALAYNFHDVTTNRTVSVAGTDRLTADFRANGIGARIEGGYRFAVPIIGVTPYAAAQVQAIALPGYGETAASGSAQFALNYAAQTATQTRGELGAWFDKNLFAARGALVTFYGRAAWAHDFGDTTRASAIFQALPGSNFVVNGAAPKPDSALTTAGAQYRLANGWSFLAKFDGEFSSTTSIYTGTGMVRKVW